MMNRIFYGMVLVAFLVTGWRQYHWERPPEAPKVAEAAPPEDPEELRVWKLEQFVAKATPPKPKAQSPMEELGGGLLDACKAAVELSIGLVGGMTFFLGLMKVAEAAGLLAMVASAIRPLMVILFPDVPPNHPAMGAMIMNLSANVLGLGNAATPFGLKAMQELDTLNPNKGTATNAMVMFLAINTSGVTILPTGVIALRHSLDSADPASILGTTLFATTCSTLSAIGAVLLVQRFYPGGQSVLPEGAPNEEAVSWPLWASLLSLGAVIGSIPLMVMFGEVISPWLIPVLTLGFLSVGVARGVAVYEAFVEGARDGFGTATRIIPYLVAIMGAVAMLRSSGAIAMFTGAVGPFTEKLGLPAEAIPMALLRPLSGSGAYGVMTATLKEHGPDSYLGTLVSTMQGGTETTFYVLAVYFGAVAVKNSRHALIAGLTADVIGPIGAITAVQAYFWFKGIPV